MAGLVVKPQMNPEPVKKETPGLEIAGAGEGVKAITNPLAGLTGAFTLPSVSQEEYDGAAGQNVTTTPGKAGDLIALAKKYVGTPYEWGKSSPLAFDCSGFTQYVFKQFGVDLPRISNQQGFGGRAVKSMAEAQPGDLIFWDNSSRNNGADHVGIYLGNGMLISAPKPGDRVKIQAVYGNPFFRRYL